MNSFWVNPAEWPSDPPGWIFLARASQLLGSAMFEGWGKGGFAQCDLLGLSVSTMRQKSKPRSFIALRENDPKLVTQVDPKKLADSESQLRDNLAKKYQVISKLREWAEEQPQLRSAVRPTMGGPLRPLDPVVWSNQHLSNWFICCQMNPKEPYSTAFSGRGFQQIFIDRDQLAALIRVRIEGSEAAGDLANAGIQSAPLAKPSMNTIEMEPRDRGGASPEIEKWQNLVAITAAVMLNVSFGGNEPTKAQLRKTIEDYADSIGLSLASRNTLNPAIQKAINLAWREHRNDGKPLFAADGARL